jgi:TRAP-type C4-dicarboxylate transport system permease small subunit
MLRACYDRAVTTLAVTAVSVMLGAALIGTISRYLTFLPSISWGEEVTRFAGIWAVFLVAGLSIRRGAHLGVDVLAARFSPGARRRTRLFGQVLILAFSGILLVYGLRLALENRTQYSPALEWSMGAVYLCIPIGAALMIVESLRLMRRLLRGDPPPEPAATSRIE